MMKRLGGEGGGGIGNDDDDNDDVAIGQISRSLEHISMHSNTYLP